MCISCECNVYSPAYNCRCSFPIGGAPQACCLTVSNTRIQFGNILDYSIQDVSICHIRAVRQVQGFIIDINTHSIHF